MCVCVCVCVCMCVCDCECVFSKQVNIDNQIVRTRLLACESEPGYGADCNNLAVLSGTARMDRVDCSVAKQRKYRWRIRLVCTALPMVSDSGENQLTFIRN